MQPAETPDPDGMEPVAPRPVMARRAVAWDNLKPWVFWIAGCMVFGWFLSIMWWAFLSPEAREDINEQLVIPLGTAEAIAKGRGAPFVPNTLALRPGGRITIINEDNAEHSIGNNIIPPGATAEITAPADGSGGFVCSIHPSGFIGVGTFARPPFINTIIPTLFIGIPLGLSAGFAAWVGRKLGD